MYKQKSIYIICQLLDKLELVAPDWYSSADIIAEADDLLKELEK